MHSPPPARREPSQIGALAILAVAATALLVATGSRGGEPREAVVPTPGWSGLVADHTAQVSVGDRRIVVLKAPSLADRVARSGGRAADVDQRRWTREALAKQRDLFARLELQGIELDPEFIFTRVLNGFSAPLNQSAIAVLERAPEVRGVYRVGVGYPAAQGRVPLRPAPGLPTLAQAPSLALPGADGRGITIALLDTGVDRGHPFLGGRVRRGIDVISGDRSAAAEANPDDETQLERHGTEMAGILVGRNGPSRLTGIAPRAAVLPIRVAGWQQDAAGGWVVYSRTDQLIAGLERAVDPNLDGDAYDGARITLVSVAEPYAAFADGPAALAVEGAFRLDSLVVVPAGNDGAGGPAFGRISGPGGAPAALTVGALDMRAETQEVSVVLRIGLMVKLARSLSLAGATPPSRAMTLSVGAPRASRDSVGTSQGVPPRESFFDEAGHSLVAGRAALVEAGSDPRAAAEHAAAGGAHAVLLYGGQLPAGALALDAGVDIPVLGIPASVAGELLAAVRAGEPASASFGPRRAGVNPGLARVAGFSSRGLAFDGRVKPDVTAPGVAVGTAEPGVGQNGVPRFGTVNGSSAAAATVAGAAAVLAQARRGLDARALKGLLVGSARPLPAEPVAAQGAGLVDLGAASAAELAVEPGTLALGWGRAGSWRTSTPMRVRNLSQRSIRVALSMERRSAAPPVSVSFSRRFMTIPAGRERMLRVRFRSRGTPPAGSVVEGAVRVRPQAGVTVRVPWTLVFRPAEASLIRSITLEPRIVRPSDVKPAVMSLRAGHVLPSAELRAVSRLELELWTKKGQRLGLLTRLRDLLPGNYLIGLTGRGPGGQVLGRGSYRLKLTAFPTSSGRPTTRIVRFQVRKSG